MACRSLLLALVLLAAGCPRPVAVDAVQDAAPAPVEVSIDSAYVPSLPTAYSPSLVRLAEGETYNLDLHLAVGECAGCHQTIATEWNDSLHALSSLSNPFYRASFFDFVGKRGQDKGAFCGGCHDPGLMFDGAIKEDIPPDAKRTHIGVSCATCHGIAEATIDGNGSYVLSTRDIPIPDGRDDEKLKAHRARVASAVLRTDTLCASCHKGFLSPSSGHEVFLPAIDEFTPWHRSGYAENPTTRIVDVKPKGCTGCHMPEVGEGKDAHPSHRFAGGHIALAHMKGSEGQIAAVEKLLKGALTVDVPAYGVGKKIHSASPEPPKAGAPFWFDVVLHNREIGHPFPGGAKDLRDTWLEVELVNGKGERVAVAGTDHEATGDDKEAYVLHAYMTDEKGTAVGDHSVHDIRTAAYVNSVGPKDSRVVRYTFDVPADVDVSGLKVRARLRHRRLTESFRRSVCEVSKTERDLAFQRAARTFREFDRLDPCEAQPVFDIDSYEAPLDGTLADVGRPLWQRHLERALGLQHHLQEDLKETTEAIAHTLSLLDESTTDRVRAKVLFEQGRAEARLGRTDAALATFDEAEGLVGEHAAIHFQRGLALQRVFKNKEAVRWHQRAAALAKDDRVYRELAKSAGSVGLSDIALDAARKGLAIAPRDPDLLRSQLLALRKLGAPADVVDTASRTYDAYKKDELAATVRDRCSKKDVHCQLGRRPVRTIALRHP